MHDVLINVVPWAQDVRSAAVEALTTRKKFPSLRAAIICVDFYRFDSITTSVAEQAIVLSEAGLSVTIVCNNLSDVKSNLIKPREQFVASDYDILIYHYYVGDSMLQTVLNTDVAKVVFYHGITTPPEVYAPYSPGFVDTCKKGLTFLKELSGFDYIFSNSESNINQVAHAFSSSGLGFNMPFKVISPVISLGRFNCEQSEFSPQSVHLITVGRVFSSKNLEGVIAFANQFKEVSGLNVKLTIAGSKCEPAYMKALLEVNSSESLEINYCFRSSDESLKKLYQCADVFVSFSHHEGFCIPLVEAMASNLLVVSHRLTAIPETMCGAGVLVAPYDYVTAANKLNLLWRKGSDLQNLIQQQRHVFETEYLGALLAGRLLDSMLGFIKFKGLV